MKKLAIATLILLGGSGIIAQAKPFQNQEVYLSNTGVLDLVKVNENEIGIAVTYPGASISGVCALEIRSDSSNRHHSIENFLSAIVIRPRFDFELPVKVINAVTIDIDLSAQIGSFGVWMNLATKDGSSIASTIKRTLGENRTVVVVPTSCK